MDRSAAARRILIVEDDPKDVELTIRALKRNSIANEIVVVEDGVEALDYLLAAGRFAEREVTDQPAVVLLDLKLPKIDGLEVLARVRADPRTRRTPVVLLTSSREERDMVTAYERGANSYVRKPVDFAEFVEAVRGLGVYWLLINEPPPPPERKGVTKAAAAARLLVVDDSAPDTDLVVRGLRQAGYDLSWERVETAAAMEAALASRAWDAVLCDFALPGFGVQQALDVLRRSGRDLPFIVVSGAVGEEVAAEAMRAGAHDFVRKDHLGRLAPALEREIREAAQRAARRDQERAVAALQERLRTTYDALACGVIVRDGSGAIVEANDVAQRMFGAASLAEMRARSPVVRRLREDGSELPASEAPYAVALRTRRPERGVTMGALLDDGSTHWFQADAVPVLRSDGEMAQVVSSFVEITGRKRAEEELRLLQSAVENANDAVVITDADLERPGPRVIYVNPAYTRMTGYAAEEVIGGSPRISQGPDTDADVRVRLRQTLGQGRTFRGENVNYRKDGTAYDVELHIAPIRDLAGRTTHFVSVQRDVTERKRAERELERLALYDALTGLPNRGLFHDRLELAIAGASREGSSLALLLVDLDHFKEVNDTFGHPAGDVLLQQVAERLRSEVRAIDTVARFGGDEYAVLLPEAAAASAAKVAQKLLTALERPFTVEAQTVGIGASFGISIYPDHGEDADVLLRHADIAMYAAKGSGSGHAIYSLDQDQSSPGRLARVAELRQAIHAGALVLHYQPIVSLTTGRATGIEALARWPHPEHGLIPPVEFILLAERTGLIRPLTEWVLGTAVRECAAWQQAGHTIPVAVNVSMRSLLDPDLPNTVGRLLASARLEPSLLRLEITESVMMADPARTLAVVERFRETGVLVEVDDFGTGYSSLAYLQRLPVDVVKIDRSFVGQMTTDEDSAAIVRSMVGLAHSLGLGVVAEGVEDGETWDQLAALGCDEAQGHYLSPPLAASELERWLSERALAMRGELMGGSAAAAAAAANAARVDLTTRLHASRTSATSAGRRPRSGRRR